MFRPAEVPICWQQQSFWMPWSAGNVKCIKTRVNGRRKMEQLKFDYPSAVRPVETGAAHVSILTSVNGFGASWKAVMDRFFAKYDGAVRIDINDAGATPGSVMLRLEQAVEVIDK